MTYKVLGNVVLVYGNHLKIARYYIRAITIKNVGRAQKVLYTCTMHVHICSTTEEIKAYDKFTEQHKCSNLWQSAGWRALQKSLQRKVVLYTVQLDQKIIASAQVIIDTTSFGYSTWEIPRGPIWNEDYTHEVIMLLMQRIIHDANQQKCIQVYMSPVQTIDSAVQLHMHDSHRYTFPEASLLIDITKSESEILAQMKSKGRYNIKVAEKNGVTVAMSHDADAFSTLHTTTAHRNNFKKPTSTMYSQFLKTIPGSFLLLAHHSESDSPIAGLIGVLYKDVCIYYYGASNYAYRAHMAPYVLQWHAILHAKQAGASTYDLFGIAPADEQNHPWQELNGFKEKFGGQLVTYIKEQSIILRPIVRTMLDIKRKIY